jgi:homospermidine synthase
MDNAELVRGSNNTYIQPIINDELRHPMLTELFKQDEGTDVVFLRENGYNVTLPSVCPVPNVSGDCEFECTSFRGKLIHHGEVFELARYFGESAPFMSYVYKNNLDLDRSIVSFMKRHNCSEHELLYYIKNNPQSYEVFNNIHIKNQDRMKGFDSIGCAIYCGKSSVERIMWCGSVLEDSDPSVHHYFTPTVMQVAAGVLSGLSYILEDDTLFGLYEPCDVPTPYMITKSRPLLGNFMLMEIPVSHVSKLDIEIL